MNHYRNTFLIILTLFVFFVPKVQAQDNPNEITITEIRDRTYNFLDSHPEADTAELLNFIVFYGDFDLIIDDDNYVSETALPLEVLYNETKVLLIPKKEAEPVTEQQSTAPQEQKMPMTLIIVLAAVLVVLIAVVIIIKSRKKGAKNGIAAPAAAAENGSQGGIEVRHTTNTVLRKQSLDDVKGDPSYMKIECSDFCADSAVKTMYIKDTCIRDIYNMYAENLRSPKNPGEYGCLVLGRWVKEEASDKYLVSLESIVLPGDDAVFSEYELNFGGKIQLKAAQELKKLRAASGLQYDRTCWVHSHPGLGVFFSNSDYNVQMQLKHATHPRFLTALVIDIFTPTQELGIFTFKHGGEGEASVNSKTDILKFYSLVDWYKWSIENIRKTFKPEDHFNVMSTAKEHIDNCYGIELSNGAVIDISHLTDEQREGFVGTAHGFVSTKAEKTEYVVTKVSTEATEPDTEPFGCFVIASHCSTPSIRKVLADRLDKIKFVLVYSTTDGLLTSIPIVNNDLCAEQKYQGEQQLEELKIWTRRKR